MKQINLFFKTMLILCALVWSGNCAWAQSDMSAIFTSNVTLPSSGTNVSSCVVSIGGKQYDGTKLGKSGSGASAKITVPSGTKHIHLHVAAWKGKTATLTVKNGSENIVSNVSLTSDDGVSNSSPFTLSNQSNATTNYYKVVTLSTALSVSTEITIQSNSERCVIWGVNSEQASSDEVTTVTIDNSGITNTDIANGTAAGSLSAVVKDASSNTIDGATVTWSSSNPSVATIDEATGVVTLVKKGTTTLKATYAGVDGTYQSSSDTYDLTVVDTKRYSVTEAIAIINGSDASAKSSVYVQGKISKIDYINTDAGKGYATYWISADGTTNGDQLEIYQGKYVDNVDFKSQDDIKVGDFVVVLGDLTKYNSTYEFVAGNYIVTHTPDSRIVTSLSWSSSEVEIDKGAADNEYTLPTLNNPQNVSPIIYTITGTDNLAIEVDGVILVDTDVEGSVSVTATFAGNVDYKDATASYTITVIDRNKKGTINNPYTVADVKNGTATGSGIYVIGYIVGNYNAEAPINPATGDTNLALADAVTEKSGGKTIPVELVSGTIRTNWGPKSNDVIGKKVLLKGNAKTYFSVKGIKGTNEINLIGLYVAISEAGLATYASDEVLDYTNVEDIEAYIAIEGEKGKVNLKRVKKVPAATGVLLRALNGKTDFDVPVTTADADKVDGNAFVRGEGKAVESGKGPFNYILSKKGNEIGFYHANNNVVAKNRAYLQLTTNNARLNLNFDEGELTGIEEVSTQVNETKDAMFDLQGRQVVKPAKGLYIKNGKRVVIK